ncbi:MAG: thiamine pyridinylase [Crocosphaera sp.]|nr:thiamine pyridinylase [Crocosphaera sp.]
MMQKQNIYSFMLMLVFSLILSIVNVAPANATELKVALYPYVPDVEQFETAIETKWHEVQPDILLTFTTIEEWDGGYDKNPPTDADVYVFDAMFFDYFKSQNFLEPLKPTEIEGKDDFVDYAVEGVKVDQQYFAIPQLGCANVLFYHQDDNQIADATNLTDIVYTLDKCTYTSEIPSDQRGLMLDMAGGTTNAALYLDIAHSITGEYPFSLPSSSDQLNPEAMDNMRELLAMASYGNATDTDPPNHSYERSEWFSNGWGRAVMGYTESMSAMSEETRENIGFKVMPLSKEDESYPAIFYADVIGVNTTTRDRGTRDLAVRLANVMADSETMVLSIGPDQDRPYPQYLMATRPSIFQTLERKFPLYGEMYQLIEDNDPVMFKLNSESRDWIASMKNIIREEAREDYACGCDYPALQTIFDNDAAPPICNATCAEYGGWNGQWTNDYPAAQEGSVCGCNVCGF